MQLEHAVKTNESKAEANQRRMEEQGGGFAEAERRANEAEREQRRLQKQLDTQRDENKALMKKNEEVTSAACAVQ